MFLQVVEKIERNHQPKFFKDSQLLTVHQYGQNNLVVMSTGRFDMQAKIDDVEIKNDISASLIVYSFIEVIAYSKSSCLAVFYHVNSSLIILSLRKCL